MAEVETLMLANHAEATNGLLYVLGGAWTHHWRPPPAAGEQAQPSSISVAAVFLVQPDEVGRQHSFLFRIEPEEGEEILRLEGDLRRRRSGRPRQCPLPQRLRGEREPGVRELRRASARRRGRFIEPSSRRLLGARSRSAWSGSGRRHANAPGGRIPLIGVGGAHPDRL
jgi:hypothetical protein